ncbi:chemotaxis protein CheE [Caulobacter sp. ErkDOM-E]|uniref:chemotaxis protein CheE n=1 Tax=Caulobacter sp. ErkDOM-E TaxID=3402778 RepID=UPI003AF46FC1
MSQPSRLTRFMDLPDGLAVDEALARADASLESHRQAALQLIDQALGELADAGSRASAEALARLSDSIGSLAGMFQLNALCRVAKRLGDIVRTLNERGGADHDLIGLHITALRVIRVQPDGQGAAELLKGLDQIAAREARRASR